jgi:hypothetical protein
VQDGGNFLQRTGYACLFPAMIGDWRGVWSAHPGTTHPTAPFGFVELADGSDEAWGLSMAALRHAATAGYGGVPNPAMPAVYRALGHDAGDQWDASGCALPPLQCCVPTWQPLGRTCLGDHRGQFDWWDTNWFQGQVHPRPKALIGRRLAQAAFASVYLSSPPSALLAASGPRLSGCTYSAAARTLTLRFNATLLRGAALQWAPSACTEEETTALYVLPSPLALPDSAGDGHHGGDWRAYEGPFANGNEGGVRGWVAVNAAVVAAAREGEGEGGEGGDPALVVDLGEALGGVAPTAVRYAWGTGGWGAPYPTRMCTGIKRDCSREPCNTESCPLFAGGLPGEPFLARIVEGACQCLPPQQCS